MLLAAASISGTTATFFGVIIGLLTATLAATWRIGNKIGEIKTDLKNDKEDIQTLQVHQYNHDQWHLHRGDK